MNKHNLLSNVLVSKLLFLVSRNGYPFLDKSLIDALTVYTLVWLHNNPNCW